MTDEQPYRRDAGLAGWGRDLRDCLSFLTRLPIAASPDATAPLSRTMRAFPLAGALTGLIGGLAYWLADICGLPPVIAATLAAAALVAVTGAMHEDGLADTADGFGGGWRREAKLEIMRDSRLGTYGAVTLVFSLILRIAAIAAIGDATDAGGVMLALIGAEAWSRALIVWLLAAVPPARAEGQSHSAGTPQRDVVRQALIVGGVLAALLFLAGFGLWPAIAAFALSLGAYALVRALCLNQIGGQTGDTAGAVQQAGAIAVLVALVATL